MKPDSNNIRVDAREKLNGSARYIRDEKIPGLWYGITVRSEHSRAIIKSITFDKSFDWKSVAVVTSGDISNNYVAMLENDMPFLAAGKVNYKGEPIVLIAGEDKNIIREAAANVSVEYEILPPLFDMEVSEINEIKIFGENNVFKKIDISKGDVQNLSGEMVREVTGRFETGYQEHLYLEPQGIVAIPDDDGITIKGSMQCPYYIKNTLDKMFDGKKHVTVIQSVTGGAFGGKEDFPSLLAGHAALLADKSGHAVAMFYDREEDVKFTTKRHPSVHNYKAYVSEKGKVLGLEMDIILDGGAYCTLSQVVLSRAALTATGSYFIPNVRITAKAVATNTVPSGAFRGFGGPQAVFAIEMLMDKIAHSTGMSPAEIRKQNLLEAGHTTATGQKLHYSISAKETFDDTLQISSYENTHNEFNCNNLPILAKLSKNEFPKRNRADKLKGVGISCFLHGAGFTGTGENKIRGKIKLEISTDGIPVLFTAQTEMGQGEQTAFLNILAGALEVERTDLKLSEVNTDLVPDSGPTVASRSTMIVGSLIIDAAKDLIEQMKLCLNAEFKCSFRYANGFFECDFGKMSFHEAALKCRGLKSEKEYSHPPFIKFDDINYKGDAYPVFSWGAAAAVVEVDPVTFEINVKKYFTSQDIGKAINYDQSVAQIEGGTLQGIGYAVYEKINLKDGMYDVNGFTDYIIPTATEMPEMKIKIVENPYPYGPFGAKGLGEMPLVGATPAVISALNMIFGTVFSKLPVTPEDLFAHVKKLQSAVK